MCVYVCVCVCVCVCAFVSLYHLQDELQPPGDSDDDTEDPAKKVKEGEDGVDLSRSRSQYSAV
jgi:hypothetical protein